MSDKPITWKSDPEEHDFPAAASYLSLLAPQATVDAVVTALRVATTDHRFAKDILRSARLPLLDTDNAHVKADLDKVEHGHALSPVLLVRGDLRTGAAATIADGYHRVCASYHLDENTPVPCRLVDLPS